jgi:uracil phosphoribosyltransferase
MLKVVDHLLVQDRLTMIRRSGISRANFRAGLIELGKFISYEFANTLEKQYLTVKTPLGSTECVIIKEKCDVVVINILRAAIPFVEGIMGVFTESDCGVIAAQREDIAPFKVNIKYIRIPPINGKIVLVADPMLATGNTMNAILSLIKNHGNPKRLVLFNVIASEAGIKKVSSEHSDLEIYTCAIDSEVNSNDYIIPGLGDAGDKCFGNPGK